LEHGHGHQGDAASGAAVCASRAVDGRVKGGSDAAGAAAGKGAATTAQLLSYAGALIVHNTFMLGSALNWCLDVRCNLYAWMCA
jgi:hypothetical protein